MQQKKTQYKENSLDYGVREVRYESQIWNLWSDLNFLNLGFFILMMERLLLAIISTVGCCETEGENVSSDVRGSTQIKYLACTSARDAR
jgi:hypothetical protein